MTTRIGDKTLAVILLIVAAATALYWITWYLAPGGEDALSVMPGDAAHKRFEDAFLVADTWMAFAAVMAAVRLLSNPAKAIGWLYMAGSAGIFLAAMDILYCLQNGIYPRIADPALRAAVATEMTINIASLLFAGLALGRARRSTS
jgi:hypothetical protein